MKNNCEALSDITTDVAELVQLHKKWHIWIESGQLNFTFKHLEESSKVLEKFGENVRKNLFKT